MSSLTGIPAGSRTQPSAASDSSDNKSAGDIQVNFLKMLLTQLKNQDPTDPLKNNELTAQLAQISTVQGIEKLNSTVNNMMGQMESGKMLEATKLVGAIVLVPGNSLTLGAITTQPNEENPPPTDPVTKMTKAAGETDVTGETEGTGLISAFGAQLQGQADTINITIKDKDGNVVRTIEEKGIRKPGIYNFQWDGLNNDGNPAEVGAYQFELEASLGGNKVPSESLRLERVQGVVKSPNGPLLELGFSDRVSLDDIRSIF